jgi:predicted unusual protein kinase regulating ubiquinone biosynthesis (AarF/ABC1/UbiB family)
MTPAARRPTHVKGRALRLATMTASVAGRYAGYLLQRLYLDQEQRESRLSSAHAAAGRRVRDELMLLRGPAMKLGQALSLHTDIVPGEMLAELAKLQMQAPGMHPTLVRAQFRTSMGRLPEEAFRRFDPDPFAAASLGQVHRATTHAGRRVAVKIQYPGIRDAAASDFRWLRSVARPAQVSGHVSAAALDELEGQILAETDYCREADNIEFFRAGLQPLGFVTVPTVVRECSTDRILTMSLVPGRHLDAFLAGRPSQRSRDRIGARLAELYYFQLLVLEAVHADPHWGNYLFTDEGRIGLVDFGCVKYLQHDFVTAMSAMYLYPGRRESREFQEAIDRWYAAAGGKLPEAARRALLNFSDSFYRQVYPPDARDEQRPFDFSRPRFLEDYMRESARLLRARGLLPEYIFLARAEIGLYTTLHRLRARVPMSAIVRRYLPART